MAVRFIAASDSSLLVVLGDAISLDTHAQVAALTSGLGRDPIPHVSNMHPAYCSILLVFDALAASHEAVADAVSERLRRIDRAPAVEARIVEIPVCYGGEFGPDLETLAEARKMTQKDVILMHSGAIYTAYFIGFVPGFAYLGGLPAALEASRLTTPRPRVPAGSVGIAGAQTGVYPIETPGGWRLVGRTPLRMFDPGRDPMSRIALGDRVRFVPINPSEFKELAR